MVNVLEIIILVLHKSEKRSQGDILVNNLKGDLFVH